MTHRVRATGNARLDHAKTPGHSAIQGTRRAAPARRVPARGAEAVHGQRTRKGTAHRPRRRGPAPDRAQEARPCRCIHQGPQPHLPFDAGRSSTARGMVGALWKGETMSLKIRRARLADTDETARVFSASFRSMDFVPKLHSDEEDRVFVRNLIAGKEVWLAL